MKNIWSTIFTKAVVDRSTNSLSLFDCVDEITINFSNAEDISKPQKNIPINFAVVSLWISADSLNNKEFEYVIEIFDPENKKISEITNKLTFEKGKKRLRTIAQINGLTLTTEGEYNIVIKYKEGNGKFVVASKIPLDIRFLLQTRIKNKNK